MSRILVYAPNKSWEINSEMVLFFRLGDIYLLSLPKHTPPASRVQASKNLKRSVWVSSPDKISPPCLKCLVCWSVRSWHAWPPVCIRSVASHDPLPERSLDTDHPRLACDKLNYHLLLGPEPQERWLITVFAYLYGFDMRPGPPPWLDAQALAMSRQICPSWVIAGIPVYPESHPSHSVNTSNMHSPAGGQTTVRILPLLWSFRFLQAITKYDFWMASCACRRREWGLHPSSGWEQSDQESLQVKLHIICNIICPSFSDPVSVRVPQDQHRLQRGKVYSNSEH